MFVLASNNIHENVSELMYCKYDISAINDFQEKNLLTAV